MAIAGLTLLLPWNSNGAVSLAGETYKPDPTIKCVSYDLLPDGPLNEWHDFYQERVGM